MKDLCHIHYFSLVILAAVTYASLPAAPVTIREVLHTPKTVGQWDSADVVAADWLIRSRDRVLLLHSPKN